MANLEIDATELKAFDVRLRALKDKDLAKEFRLMMRVAAEPAAAEARGGVPKLTGAAAGSVRTFATARQVGIRAGSAKVPYFGWLDYGGKVGRRKSIFRTFISGGRFIYPAARRHAASATRSIEQTVAKFSDRILNG